jgi:guanine nucleotide-binding protein G(i) subunit alpha
MGACASDTSTNAGALPNEAELAKRANTAMGKEKDANNGIKLLLLGAGGSGKTTFRKQLRSIYSGYPENERKEAAVLIIDNLWDAVGVLYKEAQERNLSALLDANSEVGSAFLRADNARGNQSTLSPELANDLQLVWAHADVQEMVKERQKFHLQECAVVFFNELRTYPEWAGPGWLPAVDDCIRARVRSSGVVEEPITIDGTTFMIFDAGGQRSERRKWIHYFDRVNALMFVTSLTAYAENLFEDETQNNMVESLALFENLANSKWFHSTPILLFLNKRDLFEVLFVEQQVPLDVSGYFPDAPDSTNPDVAVRYIIDQYVGRKRLNPNHPNETIANLLYPHVTTAVDRSNTQKVFDTCKTIIIKQALQSTGFTF